MKEETEVAILIEGEEVAVSKEVMINIRGMKRKKRKKKKEKRNEVKKLLMTKMRTKNFK